MDDIKLPPTPPDDKKLARRRYAKERRERNKEASLQRERAYLEANKERIKQYQKEWREANREHVRRYDKECAYKKNRQWQKDNHDKHLANVKAYNERNREIIAVKSSERYKRRILDVDYLIAQRYTHARIRAREKGWEFDLTREYLLSIYPTDNICPMYGVEFDLTRQNQNLIPSLDRIDNNLGYIKGNVWFICYRANVIKRQQDVAGLQLRLDKMKDKIARGKQTNTTTTVDELTLILEGLKRKVSNV
jgi:hypothetical protein